MKSLEKSRKLKMATKENQLPQFGLCLNNDGYAASLEVGKVYHVIPDDEAAVHGYIRVIDESGEEYAYTANRFHLIQLPIDVENTLLSHLTNMKITSAQGILR